jgi:GTPase
LVHLIDIHEVALSDPLRPYRLIENELLSYSKEMENKPRIIALNKVDLIAEPEVLQQIVRSYGEDGQRVVLLSALRGDGIVELLRILTQLLSASKQAELPLSVSPCEEG